MKLSPIRPAAPIRAKYEARLLALVDEMHASIVEALTSEYRRHYSPTVIIANDEGPAQALQGVMNVLGQRWASRLSRLSENLADYFSKAVRDRVDRTLKSDLRRGGMSVKFQMSDAMRDAFEGVRAENVGLIKSIAQEHLAKVETMVMQSVSRGGDLHSLTRDLMKIKGVTKRRAVTIATHQNNQATATMRSARERELGITEGIWRHSGGGKYPRPAHKAFSGKRFKLSEGHDFGDGFGKVLPGQAINCHCTWRAIVPGFDD